MITTASSSLLIRREIKRLLFGQNDFLGVGTSVGFLLILPLILLTYIWDGNLLIFVSI